MLTMNVQYEPVSNQRDDSRLCIRGLSAVSDQSDWAISPHQHEDVLELILLLNGSGKLHYDNRCFDTAMGDLIILNPHMLHEEEAEQGVAIEHIAIQFSGVKLDGLPENYLLPRDMVPVLRTGDSFELLKSLFEQIKRQCMEKPLGFAFVIQDMSKTILSIVTQLLLNDKHMLEPQSNRFPAIQEITAYLDQYYCTSISLEHLSTIFHFSMFYIARKFKDETGCTINQYIIKRRIGEAERLLTYGNESIKEIARKTGFQNLNYFHNVFKKQTGRTPCQFRELYRR